MADESIWTPQDAIKIADFWVSRSIRDDNGKYHILIVVGADEYAERGYAASGNIRVLWSGNHR